MSVRRLASDLGFTGYRRDAETGLDYSLHRYYAPDLGRFTTEDPITETEDRLKDTQGLNFFGYVKGNPLKYTDPDGLEWLYNDGTKEFAWRDSEDAPLPFPENGGFFRPVRQGEPFYDLTNWGGQFASLNAKHVKVINPHLFSPLAFEEIGRGIDRESADLPASARSLGEPGIGKGTDAGSLSEQPPMTPQSGETLDGVLYDLAWAAGGVIDGFGRGLGDSGSWGNTPEFRPNPDAPWPVLIGHVLGSTGVAIGGAHITGGGAGLALAGGPPGWVVGGAAIAGGGYLVIGGLKSLGASLGAIWSKATGPNGGNSASGDGGGSGGEPGEGPAPADPQARNGSAEFPEWKSGDPITKLTPNGEYPQWYGQTAAEKPFSIQGRYWINRALGASPGEFTQRQLSKMRAGFAPQARVLVRVLKTGKLEIKNVSKEIHHNLRNRGVPGYDEPVNLREVWPWEHDAIDKFRNTGYEFIRFLDE